MERNAMLQPPRPASYNFLNWKELSRSILQGLAITAGILFVYQYSVRKGGTEDETRTMVFVTLVFTNILLTLVNRSSRYSVFETMKNKNGLIVTIIDNIANDGLYDLYSFSPFILSSRNSIWTNSSYLFSYSLYISFLVRDLEMDNSDKG